MQDFLSTTKYIDYKDEAIQMKIRELFSDNMDDVEKTKIVYHFMQEEIPHSFDCNATVITAKASDVLKNRTGICHAKANLFAALLRSQNIPVGFCFEHITLADDASKGHCVHAFNAVYLNGRWVKLDVGGSRKTNAQFSLEEPILAYPPRAEYDEYFFEGIYANPHEETMNMLEQANGLQDVVKNIPEFVLEEPDIKETGKSGVLDIDARSVNKEFRERLNYNYELQH